MSYSATVRTWLHNQIAPKYRRIVFPLILLYIVLLPGIYAAAKRERPLKGITCERSIRALFEYPLAHTIYTDSRTEAILEYFYQYQYNNTIKDFDEDDTDNWENAYVIANWERLFFLNRLYNIAIPEFLYHPRPQWKPYVRISDEVNPCVIYKIP